MRVVVSESKGDGGVGYCTRARDELGWQARRGLDEMLADHWRFARRYRDGYES